MPEASQREEPGAGSRKHLSSLTSWRALAAFALLAAGCRSKDPGPSTAATGQSPPVPTAGPVNASAPQLVHAGDIASIKHYLQTVDTVRGATFDVTWAPETVRMSRDATIRALWAVSDDGSEFLFDGRESELQNVHPGSILLVWGLALRRVEAMETHGDTLYLRTNPVALSEALTRGTIAWTMPPTLDGGVFIHQPAVPDDAPVPRQSMAPHLSSLMFRLAKLEQGGQPSPSQGGNAAQPSSPWPPAPELAAPWQSGNAVWGVLGSYVWRVEVHPNGKTFQLILDIFRTDWSPQTKSDLSARGKQGAITANPDSIAAYKGSKGFRAGWKGNGDSLPMQDITASDLMDMRVHIDVHLDYNGGKASMTFTGQPGGFGASLYQNMSGNANIRIQARIGETGVFDQKFKIQIPVSYTLPFIIGGMPFMLQVGGAFIVRPTLSTRHAVLTGSAYMSFGGSSGFKAGAGHLNPDGSVTDETKITFEPSDINKIVGVGVSAVQVSAQAPRIGLGMGYLNTGVLGYTDLVHTLSIISEGQLGIAPCREAKILSVWSVGMAAQLFGPFGIGQKIPLDTVMHNESVFPDLKVCKVL